MKSPDSPSARRAVIAAVGAIFVCTVLFTPALWLRADPNANAGPPKRTAGDPTTPVFWLKLDEGSGSQVRDWRDAARAGELMGEAPPQWEVDGISGSALRFDPGAKGYVRVEDGSAGRSGRLTLSLWVKTAAANGPLVARWPTAAGGSGYRLSILDGHPRLELLLENAHVSLAGELPLPADEAWHHIAASYDGLVVRLFVDGEPRGTALASGGLQPGGTPLLLGGDSEGESFAGSIDDVRVYDAALSAVEVGALFAMDTDGDGMANVVEVQRGLDPDNPNEPRTMAPAGGAIAKGARAPAASAASALSPGGLSVAALSAPATPNHLLRIERDGANMRLSWRSTPGRLYRLEARDDLIAGSWGAFADVVASGNTAHRLDVLPLPPNRFYRLVLPDVETTLYEPPQSAPGEPCNCGGGASEMPYLHLFSGEAHYSAVDLRIKGRGLDFVWARKYRSRLGPNTAQGNGWDFSYNIRIQRLGQDIEVFDGNTRQDIFCRQPDGTYVADEFFREGTFDQLGIFTLTFADTGTWLFYPLDGSAEQGRIAGIIDRNGNGLYFNYDGAGRLVLVNDTLNRDITIAYNADGFIDTVTDFTGRQVRYSYYQNADAGGSFGDLKSVTSPAVVGTPNGNNFPVGKTSQYTYSKGLAHESLNHNLLTITDPKGQTWLTNGYASTVDPTDFNFDRVASQAWGNANETLNLFYVAQAPAPANGFAVTKSILNDRVGNVSEHLYDVGNRCVNYRAFTGRAVAGQVTTESQNRPTGQLRLSDPAFFETRYEWNADSLPTRIIYPNNNITENTHELALNPNVPRRFRGNLRTRRQLPGPLGGDQAQIVEQFEYATGGGCCGGDNFVTRAVDGRGNETNHSYDSRGNRIHTQHRIPGIVEDWEYNAFGQLTAHVLPDNGSGSRRRDEMTYYAGGPQNGYLQRQVIDAGGFALTTSLEYDAVGNIIRQVDPRGHDSLFTLNALNQVVRERSREVTDGSGIRYQRDTSYDANNNVVRTDAQNLDDQGVLQANTHFTATYDYEILNRLVRTTQEVDPGQNIVVEYEYDANRNRTLVRNGEATSGADPFNSVQTVYDERDSSFREIRAPGGPNQSSTQYDYDGNRNLTRTSEGLEAAPRITLYAYDGYNRRTLGTDAMGNVTTPHYDANGNTVSARVDGQLTDVPGGAGNIRLSETTYQYDAMDRRIRSDAAFFVTQTQAPVLDGQSTIQTFYNDNSQVIRVVDDNSRQTLAGYDTANRRQTVTDAKANTITYAYDANDNVIATTDVDKSDLGNPDQTVLTQYAYDNVDRLIQTMDNLSDTHSYSYDSRSNRVRSIDARGNTILYSYDGLNRLLQSTRLMTDTGDGSGVFIGMIVTSQSWDDSSRLTSQTDDSGNATIYAYDSLNRRVLAVNADSTQSSCTYDVHDNRMSASDANGSIVTSSYDMLNRISASAISRGPGVLGTTSETYQYDGLSRLVSAQDNDSQITQRYNSLWQLASDTQRLLTGGLLRTVTRQYDGAGNAFSTTYPGLRIINCTFDALDRPKTIADGAGAIASYSYAGRLHSSYDWITNGGLLNDIGVGGFGSEECSLDDEGGSDVVNGLPPNWGQPGRPQGWGAAISLAPNPARVEQRQNGNALISQYLYDSIRRPVQIQYGTPGFDYDLRFVDWNANDSRRFVHDGTNPGQPEQRQYFYDSAERLVASQHFLPPQPPQEVDYHLDGAGNRVLVSGPDGGVYTSDATVPEPADSQVNQYTTTPFDSRTYDRNGNLTGNGTLQLAYDYRNQLVQVTDTGTSQVSTYKYDCLGRRIEKNVGGQVARFYYDGSREIEEQSATNSTVATHVWGVGIDELLETTRNSQVQYFHADDLESVRRVTDGLGNLIEQYDYNDFGIPLIRDGSGIPQSHSVIQNPYLFTGRRYDPETGFYYFRHRYLDPRAGRFTTRDPLGTWGDWMNRGNALTYSGNNPATYRDPSGLQGRCIYHLSRWAPPGPAIYRQSLPWQPHNPMVPPTIYRQSLPWQPHNPMVPPTIYRQSLPWQPFNPAVPPTIYRQSLPWQPFNPAVPPTIYRQSLPWQPFNPAVPPTIYRAPAWQPFNPMVPPTIYQTAPWQPFNAAIPPTIYQIPAWQPFNPAVPPTIYQIPRWEPNNPFALEEGQATINAGIP